MRGSGPPAPLWIRVCVGSMVLMYPLLVRVPCLVPFYNVVLCAHRLVNDKEGDSILGHHMRI